jgi:hypothetical protein
MSTTREFGPVEPSLDHLVYAVPDLDAAARAFAAATGVPRPRAGGPWAAAAGASC